MEILNIAMKFNNFEMSEHFEPVCSHLYRVLSVRTYAVYT